MGLPFIRLIRRFSLWLVASFTVIIAAVSGLAATLQPAPPQLAFQSNRTGNWDIYLLDLNTRLLFNLTRHPADEFYPTWSASADAVAFYSSRDADAGKTGIYLADARARITPLKVGGGVYYWRPNWSPDGTRLAFMIGYNEIRLINRDGGGERQLTFGFNPVWSPAAAQPYILYYSDHPNNLAPDLYRVRVNGTEQQNLTRTPAAEWDGAWSPDGQFIVYAASVSGGSALYIMPTDCTLASATACTPRQLTASSRGNMSPAWSPDGGLIAFTSRRSGVDHLYLINADGTNERQITFGEGNHSLPAWKH